MVTNKYTFWRLIQEHPIEIPIIQRDYAQGRLDSKTIEIRNKLLSDLYDSISQDKPLDFDFVYGSLINEKFIPLDGQQRLTTLFLLHWYIAMSEGKIDYFREKLLVDNNSKFTYSTRTTAKDFCNELVAHDAIIPEKDGLLSKNIKDSSWFFLSWNKDPTIKSMLVMLDTIHTKFHQSKNFFDKLISDTAPVITFQFIELNNFGLTDDLYIKMNARGKALTQFEHFKAKLEQSMEDKHPDLLSDFSKKIDGAWTDLFWAYRNNNNVFDEEFLNFFRFMAINYYACISDKKYNNPDLSFLIEEIQISFLKYQELKCVDKKFIIEITKTLDSLQNKTDLIKVFLPDTTLINERELFKKTIMNRLSYTERIQFYALIQFVIKYGDTDTDNLIQWIRIIRNLSENTIYNRPEEFSNSIKSVFKLSTNSQEILKFISDPNNEISAFTKIQITEERIKALLILKDKKWEKVISQIENHKYFLGQIGFILKFAGISDFYESNNNTLNWSNEDNEKYYSLFNQYTEKAKTIFNEKSLNTEFKDHILERALLCKGNYTLSKGRNNSFLIYLDRDISWKRLLRDDNVKKRNYVKELLDEIDIKSPIEDLNKIINEFNTEDWRTNFIKFPDIIKRCGIKKLIRYSSKNDILLLEQTTTSGYHREYYSYSLKLKLELMGNDVNYVSDRSVEYDKYISSINGKEIQISYGQYKDTDKWKYKIKVEESEGILFDTEKEVIDYLQSNSYLK